MSSLLVFTVIEFIDWRYSQSCWYFRPTFLVCLSNLLSGSSPPSLSQRIVYIVCGLEGVGGNVELCWRQYSAGVKHSFSDQIQNLQYCFTTPNKNLGEEGASDR
jgi:hypothetical protein